MLLTARIVFFAFAALLIVGGYVGYAEKGSIISLIAGLVCGLLSLGAGLAAPARLPLACALAIASAVLVLGSQAPRVLKNPKIFPGITLVAASLVTLGVAVATLATRAPGAGK